MTKQYVFDIHPVPVGHWQIGIRPNAILFAVYQKQNWFHRRMVSLILGWEWIDGSSATPDGA